MSRNYVALIPAYKPSGPVLTELLEQLKAKGFSIIVVNDGSGPEYDDVFAACPAYVTVLTHEVNRGKGAALKTGLAYIQEHFEEGSIAVTLDADGQHSVEDAFKLCELAWKRPNALILGSRDLGSDIPLRSWCGNTITRLVYRLSTGVKVYDTQCGLRAFSSKLFPVMLEIPGERYEYEMNVLLEFAHKKIPIQERTIQTIYAEHNSTTHFNTVSDAYRIYKDIFKFSRSKK